MVDLTTADTAVSLMPTVPSITGDASFQYSIAGLFTTFVLAANGLDFHQNSGQIIKGSSPLTEFSKEIVITVTGPLNTVYAGKEVKVYIKIIVTNS